MTFTCRGTQVAAGELTTLRPIGECVVPSGDRKLLMSRNATHMLVRAWPNGFEATKTEVFPISDVYVLWED